MFSKEEPYAVKSSRNSDDRRDSNKKLTLLYTLYYNSFNTKKKEQLGHNNQFIKIENSPK